MSNSTAVEISDDDESFEQAFEEDTVGFKKSEPITLAYEISSDEDELPQVNVTKARQQLIKNLFPKAKAKADPKNSTQNVKVEAELKIPPVAQKEPSVEKMIGGVKVTLPVNPYGSQIALMAMVIKAITKSQNCLLESPTGSGKTLALLCAALAAQKQEKDRIREKQNQNYFSDHPELKNLHGASEYTASPQKGTFDNAESFFSKYAYSKKTIYSTESKGNDINSASKRQEPLSDSSEGSPSSQVTIHKKPRIDNGDCDEKFKLPIPQAEPSTPEDVSIPTIYYGARTHKQIQQVVKEFARTVYSGEAPMTVLSSREYSCIREFDRKQWASKNDMCRGCVKTFESKRPDASNCAFYNNRKALNHKTLPPVFDLEDLVKTGEDMKACPYYAAREMANAANIIFCPYNYLIEPSIRNSMQIDVRDNIVIIDEGHNIEDVCRDAATFTITKTQIGAAISELEKVSQNRYANQDSMGYIDHLLKVLNSWDQWFVNQTPLVNSRTVNSTEAVYMWAVEHFLTALDNHNIGQKQYGEFRQHAEMFCRRLREDPRTMFGVTQATGTLVESIDTILGYLFREGGKYADDFVPALVRCVNEEAGENTSWRNSQFNKSIDKDTLSLRLMCMNPAVVFEALKPARCIILASGTLTPLESLHSELATEFPLQVSPNHVISRDRVWIGSVCTCPDGSKLDCTARASQQPATQDALGDTLRHVCRVTPAGVLCFLPSYGLMHALVRRWRETDVWQELERLKYVFKESRNVRDHNQIMEDYYKCTQSEKGALLFAVYRGKVSEGMDFKDHQARAVVTIGVPYPNTFDMAVKEKMKYNDKYTESRKLLPGHEWLRVQAFRALNQAVGRCVRHRADWGAVLLADARFAAPRYTLPLSKWVRNYLGNNHHTFDSLVNGENSLESFMQNMTLQDCEDAA